MSATIIWRPVKGGKTLSTPGGTSSFITAMEHTFGPFPLLLTLTDGSKLEAMAEVYGGEDKNNPYKKLYDLVCDERFGDGIEVDAEY